MAKKLETPIVYLKGVGPQRAEILQKELSVFTFKDLLYHIPFRYVDKTKFHQLAAIGSFEGPGQFLGTIERVEETGFKRSKRLVAYFTDGTRTVELVWFKGIKWIKPKLKAGPQYIVYGKPTQYGGKWNLTHPEISVYSPQDTQTSFEPVYSTTEKLGRKGLHSKGIAKLTAQLIEEVEDAIPEILPPYLLEEFKLLPRAEAFAAIHHPKDQYQAQRASFRLKFEELYLLQLELILRQQISQRRMKGFVFEEVGTPFNTFFEEHIPFELTGAQKRVIKEIRRDLKSGLHMNRLLQGDVGSGKTLVALLTMLIAIGNGYQTTMMAPTEILATQHFNTLSEQLQDMDLTLALLTGSTPQKERRVIHEQLEDGSLDILIGTHSLLEDKVQFHNLGFVVIDEQHRFGVAQRARLWKKNEKPPHVLIMTATPIPRTLAMTFYGDLDVSTIDELPPGRKPVKTIHRYDKSRLEVFGFIEKEIAKGRQVYVVYPLIEESKKLDYKNLMDGYEAITRRFPTPKYSVSVVHGQMKPADKDYEMQQFAAGTTQIMVATTVIEVGVNVPNASIMIIESAQKFGLSQLHQLRGRVGRGADQSYCVLMTDYKLSANAKKRIETMVQTNDGFQIAEVDLELRGPGDIMGTQQSGVLDLKVASLAGDGNIVAIAREKARETLEEDPQLEMPKNQLLAREIRKIMKSRPNWSRIS